MSALGISLVFGMVAALANLFGGAIVAARPWSRTFQTYCIALGSGFMLATVITEMLPESLRLAPSAGPLFILAGYFVVHIFEHSWPSHFHFGEETHKHEFINPSVAHTALAGLATHTFFGGVSIASGFMISNWLGTAISGAVLLHNIPEGFTIASIMGAAGKSRNSGLGAAGVLGLSRMVGIFAMALAVKYVSYGLALSAGVTLYVAASDLIPEVNKRPGPRIALTVGAGVVMLVLLRMVFLGGAGH